jgi:plastocyanin
LVHRRLTSGTTLAFRLALAVLATAVLIAAFASPAAANNTRVSIANFAWSNKTPHIDLGESVIWSWTGPDTQHSITGQPPTTPDFGTGLTNDATQWDSDPTTNYPNHFPGDEYKVTFDHPGTYLFVCKVHQSVRGTVTVSDTPGDPNSDPGPAPPINFDTDPPNLTDYFFTNDGVSPAPPFVGPKGKGIGYSFSVNEAGRASADYYRVVKRGKGKKKRKRKVKLFQGYTEWNNVHVGINTVRFARRSKTFKPVPGKYVAYFRVEDNEYNSTKDITVRFTINGKKKKKH